MFVAIATTGFSQSLSKKEFSQKILAFVGEKYNVKKVTNGFKDCAYNIYKANSNNGIRTGYLISVKCFPKYLSLIKFSDGGKKFRRSMMSSFKMNCQKENSRYKKRINVSGYCKCLVSQLNKNNISFQTLRSKNFQRSKRYRKMAVFCVKQNKK